MTLYIKSAKLVCLAWVTISVAGCGFSVPNMQNLTRDAEHEEADENLILNHIRCEIHAGVLNVLTDSRFNPPETTRGAKPPDWILGWGAKVSYVLTVDEKSSFNPGVNYKNPFAKAGTFFALGGGVQTSAEAQRKETGAVTYAFSDLLREAPLPCETYQKGVLMHGNLRIPEFISNKVFVSRVPGTVSTKPASIDSSSKPQLFNAFSDEITFTVTYGASITPSWTFIRISVDPTSPLLSTIRFKTQYITITLGSVQSPSTPTKAAVLSPEAQELDNVNLIGHAIRSALVPAVSTSVNVTP